MGKYLPIRSAVIFGGVSQFHQVKEIRKGIDILVATPGRLHDLINQGLLSLKQLEVLVLDEADRMLDMGFINDIKRLIKVLPASRQNIFFSATMPEEVQNLIKNIAKSPLRIAAESKTKKGRSSSRFITLPKDKKRALLKHVIVEQSMQNVIVFARTKHGADRIAKDL